MEPPKQIKPEGGADYLEVDGRVPLLEEALEAAGGESLWRDAKTITAHVRSGGLLPSTRVPGNKFGDYTLTVEVARPYAALDPFPGPGRRGVFEQGRVRIESSGGEVLESRDDPRPRFHGLSGFRRNFRWDALDSTYFAGYAMWNYLANPVLLTRPEVTVSEGEPWSGAGARWRRLDARFDPSLDSHSAEQTFWFDDDGLLVRHDYTAAVVAPVAHAGHLCGEHREFDGLVFPTSRQVKPRRRNLTTRPGPTLVWLELDGIEVGC